MEQAYDMLSLSLQYGEKPSFTTLVKERFLDEILAEIESYSRFHKVIVQPIALQRVIVTNVDLDEDRLYFDVLYATDSKVYYKPEAFTATFRRRTDIPVNFNFSMSRIACPSCGASFDATKIKNCPYCGNKYEITSDDWALVELK